MLKLTQSAASGFCRDWFGSLVSTLPGGDIRVEIATARRDISDLRNLIDITRTRKRLDDTGQHLFPCARWD